MKPRLRILISLIALAASVTGCFDTIHLPKEMSSTEIPAAKTLPTSIFRGVSLVHSFQKNGTAGYGTSGSLQSKKQIIVTGANWISVSPIAYQQRSGSVLVEFGDQSLSSTIVPGLRRDLRDAKRLGLKVLLKPHLRILDDTWRGEIQPDDWQKWFDSYSKMVLHYAKLAATENLDAYAIGLELKTATANHDLHWSGLIDAVRVLYQGKLTYAANWDEVEHVRFWPDLDWVGVQFFPPLATSVGAPFGSLFQSATSRLSDYLAIASGHARPLVLTEVGYKSVPNAAIAPYLWPAELSDSERIPDNDAQRAAYIAFFNALSAFPQVLGVFVWRWPTDPEVDAEGTTGFSPRGKPALDILKTAYAEP